MQPIDDTVLVAYLDGELASERRAELEAWLRDHPDDAARLRLLAADADALRARFDSVLEEPVPQPLAQVVWRNGPVQLPPRFGLGPVAQRWAAAVAIFMLGGIVGAALAWRTDRATAQSPTAAASSPSGGTQPWLRRAAVAHAVYVPEVRHPVEVEVAGKTADERREQEQHLARWLTRRLDMPVKLFDLHAEGFDLVGGRLLPDAAGPSAQLMYEATVGATAGNKSTGAGALQTGGAASGAGAPKPVRVTVYLRKPDDATPASFRYERQGELGVFYWVEGKSAHGGPTGYALVGALPRDKLLALAEAIYRQGRSGST